MTDKIQKIAIIIAGATGVGKTSVACAVAERLSGEIISSDARQVYRGMFIGTASPVNENIRHHLVGILDPNEKPTAKWWADKCARTMEDLHEKGKLPIIAGGTGLYMTALVEGLFDAPPPSPELRKRLRRRAETGEDIHSELEQIDPESAGRIHPNNIPRIIRALEVYHQTGKTLTELFAKTEPPAGDWTYLKFHLTRSREKLYARIDRRTEEMFEAGWIEEVEKLLGSGVSTESPSMDAIGYSQICGYLRGGIDFDELKAEIKKLTRNYAKRQLTWFRNKSDFEEIDLSRMKMDEACELIAQKFFEKKLDQGNTPLD